MTYWRAFYHLVWATKQRRPLITPDVEQILFPAIIAKAHELEINVYALNGVDDHIHLAVAIPPRLAVATVIGEIKGRSSFVVNHKLDVSFAWQAGFGALTLGEKQLPWVIQYVQNQKTHHAEGTIYTRLERCLEEDDGPPPVLPG